MKSLRVFALLILASVSAFAWPSCSGQWVSVPQGTSSANGILYSTGDLLFQCQAKPTNDPKGTAITNTLSSTSNSNATATGGNATATGGNASQKQGQNQSQSNSSTNNNASEATNNGNNSSYNNVENFRVAAASAIAPANLSTAPCLASFGGAAQAIPGGVSFGGSRVDKGCDDRQTALLLIALHNPMAAAKVICSTKSAKRAKLTMDECMAFAVPPAPVVVAPAPIVTPAPAVAKATVEIVYTPIPQEVTVTATKAQVRAADKPVKHSKPCVIPKSLEK